MDDAITSECTQEVGMFDLGRIKGIATVFLQKSILLSYRCFFFFFSVLSTIKPVHKTYLITECGNYMNRTKEKHWEFKIILQNSE